MAGRALALADPQALRRGPCTLTATGLEWDGEPTYEQYVEVGAFITRAHTAAGWWLADWLRYGDRRTEWAERLSQVQEATGLSFDRLEHVRAVGAIEKARRRATVEFHLHAEVCRLPPDEQTEWLDRTEYEGWTRAELRLHMRAAKRRAVIEGQMTLSGLYRVILADPPWRYGDSGVISGTAYGRAEQSYPTMAFDELCALPVPDHVLPNATLFLWVPVPLLPEGLNVAESWGFTYKSHRVWDKGAGLPSHYAQQITHELLLVAVRGDGQPDMPTPHEASIVRERVRGEHSEKPGEVRRWIERHWTVGPYLELFGRTPVDGWTVFGNDARLWESV